MKANDSKISLLVSALGIIIFLSIPAVVAALDQPHDTNANLIDCTNCHWPSGAGEPPWNTPGPGPDDSVDNKRCTQCHGVTATSAVTHSTDTTGSTRWAAEGGWRTECVDCHNPHYKRQPRRHTVDSFLATCTVQIIGAYNGGTNSTPITVAAPIAGEFQNYYLIPNTTYYMFMNKIKDPTDGQTTFEVVGQVNPTFAAAGDTCAIVYARNITDNLTYVNPGGTTMNATVKHYRPSGVNGPADSTNKPTSICYVCHTLTSHWSTIGDEHRDQEECAGCHTHIEGFKAGGCDGCHGDPPIEPVANALSTGGINGLIDLDKDGAAATSGSTSEGEHDYHVNTLNYDCVNCHTGGMLAGASAGDFNINIGFNLGSTDLGGHYDGQVDVNSTTNDFDYAGGGTTTVEIPPTGAQTCSTLYCHSNVQGSADGTGAPDSYAAPVWDPGETADCGSCHDDNTDTAGPGHTGVLMATGSHTTHVDPAVFNYPCSHCHNAAGSGTSVHVNRTINLNIDAQFGGTYNGSDASPGDHTPGQGYGTCSTVYCHSSVQDDGGSSNAALSYASPSWGSGPVACDSCHGQAAETDGQPSTGAHDAHAAAANWNFPCSACHNNGGDGTSAHADVTLNMDIDNTYDGTASASYTQGDHSAGSLNGYGSCSTSACHGANSPTWDTAGPLGCVECHGDGASKRYPPTVVRTADALGAHVVHMEQTSSLMDGGVACEDCHTVPTNINDAGHFDTVDDAEVPFPVSSPPGNNPARFNTTVPNYTNATQTCSVYCHGINMSEGDTSGTNRTPTWGLTLSGCAICHGWPPPTAVHSTLLDPATNNDVCNVCHAHVNTTNDGFDTPAEAALHINGVTDGGGDNCSDCHSSAGGPTPGTTPDATHAKHVGDYSVAGAISTNDYGTINGGTNADWLLVNVNANAAKYEFGCGNCHPIDPAQHTDGNIDVTLNSTHGGTLKSKNNVANDTGGYAQVEGTSVTCTAAYCHSDGDDTPVFAASPEWYAGAFGGDVCANCHLNSPNTGSHGTHVVGIHYNTIYDDDGIGLETATGGVGSGAGHGDQNTSTTINCNICHASTLTASRNDDNTVCNTCHNAEGNALVSGDLTKTVHVNGAQDVAFGTITVRSKAQIRDDITTVSELDTYWLRENNYKAGTTSHDSSKATLDAAASWDGTSCSTTACHNGNSVTWGDTGVSCNSCHTELP